MKKKKADAFTEFKNSTIQNPRAPRNPLLRFGYGDIDFNRVHVGDKMWKTNDPELDKRLRQSFAGDAPRFQRPD